MGVARPAGVPRVRGLWEDERARNRALLAIVAVAYAATRLALIGRFPAFWDESFHAVQAQTTLDHPGTAFDMIADNKGPLPIWLATPLVGVGFHPVAAVRAVSFGAGAVTLTCGALLARRLGGVAAAWTAAALYVVLPFFLVHDVLGLLDPLLTATAVGSLYLQVRLAERPSLRLALALGLVMGAGLLTRQLGYLALVLLPAALLLIPHEAPGWRARAWRFARWAALAAAIALLVHSVLRLSSLYGQLPANRAFLAQYRTLSQVVHDPLGAARTNWPDYRSGLTGYVTVPLLLVLAASVVLGLRRHTRLTAVLALWGVGPIVAALLLVRYGYPRYILSAIPPLVVLMAYGVTEAARAVRARWGGDRFALAVAAVVAVALLTPALGLDARVLAHPATAKYPGEDDWQFVAGWPAGTGLGRIARALEARSSAGENTVAAIDYSPWNLAVQFDHPLRVKVGPHPSQDDITARAPGRTFRFVDVYSREARAARFVLQHDTFGVPRGVSLAGYCVVAHFRRPRGGVVQGEKQAPTTVQLYERC